MTRFACTLRAAAFAACALASTPGLAEAASCAFVASESGEVRIVAGQPGGREIFSGKLGRGARTMVEVPDGPFVVSFRAGGRERRLAVHTSGACGAGRSIGLQTGEAEGG